MAEAFRFGWQFKTSKKMVFIVNISLSLALSIHVFIKMPTGPTKLFLLASIQNCPFAFICYIVISGIKY